MKTWKTVISIAAATASLVVNALAEEPTAAGSARQFVFAVSPFLEQGDREIAFRQICGFALEGAHPGDELLVLDGVALEVVAQLKIPERQAFSGNPQARARALAAEMVALKGFLAKDRAHAPELEAVIHAPQVLALAASHLRKPGEPLTVVLIGSALYADENAAFNMLRGYVPSDGHLLLPSRQSVFGTRDKASTLRGVMVHWAYLHEAFEDAEHRQAVARLWTLFIQTQQEGLLASFAGSPTVVFQRLRTGLRDSIMTAQVDPNDREVVMRKVKRMRVEQPVEEPIPAANLTPSNIPLNPRTNVVVSADGRVGAKKPATLDQAVTNSVQAGKQGIGIGWSVTGRAYGLVDVDLYVRTPHSPLELFFARREVPGSGAKYLRDIVRAINESAYSRPPHTSWEFVEIDADVSLRETSVWLDLFRNDGRKAIHGIVVVVNRGVVLQGEFSFPAGLVGDRRLGHLNRSRDPHWIRFDLRSLVNQARASADVTLSTGGESAAKATPSSRAQVFALER